MSTVSSSRWPLAVRLAAGFGRAGTAVVRGALAARLRHVDPRQPTSWEFRGFSQNGEDGIVDYLSRALHEPNRTFVEIGAGYGLLGNGAWLAVVRRYRGLMVEADPGKCRIARGVLGSVSPGVSVLRLLATRSNIVELEQWEACAQPDVLSVDVDGIDYYLVRSLLEAGVHPRVMVVEYNSAFGPEQSLTVRYRDDFDSPTAHPSGLAYGASITAWRKLLEGAGYRFVTVESAGVNAFFVEPAAFEPGLLEAVEPVAFRENVYQMKTFGAPWPEQFARIRGADLLVPG